MSLQDAMLVEHDLFAQRNRRKQMGWDTAQIDCDLEDVQGRIAELRRR